MAYTVKLLLFPTVSRFESLSDPFAFICAGLSYIISIHMADSKDTKLCVDDSVTMRKRMIDDGLGKEVVDQMMAAYAKLKAAKVTELDFVSPRTGSFTAFTQNILALGWTYPEYYPKGWAFLLDQETRLRIVADTIHKIAPDAVLLQEAEPHAVEFLSKLLGKSYTSAGVVHDGNYHGNIACIGTAVLVHVNHAKNTQFSSVWIGGAKGNRPLAIATVAVPGGSVGLGSIHVPWVVDADVEKANAYVTKAADALKGSKFVLLGMDSNMFPAAMKAGLEKQLPAYASAFDVAEHKSPTFLKCNGTIAESGAMDFVLHNGAAKKVYVTPPFPISMPMKEADLKDACVVLYEKAGSDHAPQVVTIDL